MVRNLRSLVLTAGLATGLSSLFFALTSSTFPLLSSFTEVQARSISLTALADRQLLEADQLAAEPSTLLLAVPKYRDALKIYGEQGNKTKVLAVRQKLEAALVQARPVLEQQEQAIKKASAAFFKRYPARTVNDTAEKLKAIAETKLGFSLGSSKKANQLPKAPSKAFEAIRQPLEDYFKLQSQDPDKARSQGIPENLRNFLKTNAIALKEVRKLLLTGDIPQWQLDLKPLQEGDFTAPLPSFLGVVWLNRLLLLDALDKFQQYDNKEGLESLEASWQLRKSLNDDPRLISQLVNMVVAKSQLSVIRTIDQLPTEWQKRLLQFNHASAFITSIELESFFIFAGYNKIFENTANFPLTFVADWANWSPSMRQDYWRWYIFNFNLSSRKIYAQLPKLNVCGNDLKDLLILETSINENSVASPSWVNQWVKGKKLMLQLELTQKVLEVRSLVAKSKLPKSLPSLSSTVCPANKWVYKVSPEQVAIALTPSPIALMTSKEDLPFAYTISIKSPRE
jgi:hypothetical protein